MRSTARTKRMLQEIMNEERNGTTLEYRDGVVATLRWMLRMSEDEPIGRRAEDAAEPVAAAAERVKGQPVPKPSGKQVRRKR